MGGDDRVSSCWVFIANSFFSSHQQSVLQSTTFRPGCPTPHHTFQIVLDRVPVDKKVGIFFFCCLLEDGWGNLAETSCFAKLAAGVLRKRNLGVMTFGVEERFKKNFTWTTSPAAITMIAGVQSRSLPCYVLCLHHRLLWLGVFDRNCLHRAPQPSPRAGKCHLSATLNWHLAAGCALPLKRAELELALRADWQQLGCAGQQDGELERETFVRDCCCRGWKVVSSCPQEPSSVFICRACRKGPNVTLSMANHHVQQPNAAFNKEKYLPELLAEKDSLDPSFVHCMRLLTQGKNSRGFSTFPMVFTYCCSRPQKSNVFTPGRARRRRQFTSRRNASFRSRTSLGSVSGQTVEIQTRRQ